MKILNKVKKVVVIFNIILIISGMFANYEKVYAADIYAPSLIISSPSAKYVTEGGNITFTLTYSDNVKVSKITLSQNDIILNGFSATSSAVKNGNTVIITFKNVRSTNDNAKYITVKSGTASDAQGNVANRASSNPFFIIKNSNEGDKVEPVTAISAGNKSTVYVGSSIEFLVTYSDNVGIKSINLDNSKIVLNGFTANKKVVNISSKQAKVVLTNVRGTNGNKTITILAGSAVDNSRNKAKADTSPAFKLVNYGNSTGNVISSNNIVNNTNKEKEDGQKDTQEVKEENGIKITNTCDDSLKSLANKEITYFATWLKSSKNSKNFESTNYVAENEELNYIIDYYNGSVEKLENVTLTLTIPYEVEVLEMNSNAKIELKSADKTVITWTLDKVETLDFCRLNAKVKFKSDAVLKSSDEISKIFYSELNTKVNDTNSISYLRQIYVDKSISKVGNFSKALLFLDRTNTIRPNDEITKAEFAKLLCDYGITKIDAGSKKYRTYNDYSEIPEYAIDGVSAITDTGIIEIEEDNKFRPNNPIIRDEFMKYLVKAIEYTSDSKIKVNKSVYLINELVKDSNGYVVENKDYIMELTRLNILAEDSTRLKPDQYIKRKEAVALVRAVAFKGNNYSKIPEYTYKTLKINDIVYIYNFTNENNLKTYTYNYNNNLQLIIK